MNKDLGNYRKSYERSELIESTIPDNPLELFQKWFDEIETSERIEEPNAMTLSTVGLDGFPKSRVVLLKQFVAGGFIFYTNYDSEKGKAITENPLVCLSFFWPSHERQVIIKGKAQKTSEEVSNDYFDSRPKGSRLGAIASHQSEVIASREILDTQLKKLQEEYAEKTIKRPDFWGGYLVKPHSIEFWQGRPNRLHDRIKYSEVSSSNWKIERLAP
jgi:pyridoxamine 5'-phosphate oxidase